VIFLDTNVGVHFGKRSSGVLEQKLQAAFLDKADLVISVITLHELELGVHRSDNPTTKRVRVDLFLGLVREIIPFDAVDAIEAADIRAAQMKAGNTVGGYDLLIAAQVLRRSALLVTNNVREFSRIPRLRWEDWTQD
jgi:tRNA(fMet)-specific endonuclease VapC